MKIVFFGTPQFVVPILESLLKTHDVIALVTTPDRKVGRKQLLTPSPVKAAYQTYCEQPLAKKYYPPRIFTPEKLSTIAEELKLLQPDLFIVAAYGKIIPKAILEIPLMGAINVHPSLLPTYRGPTPIQQTLLNGDKVTGVSLIKMDEQVDHGPLLATESYEVHPTDTFETLANHLFGKAAEILPHVIDAFAAGSIKPMVQEEEKATFTKLITKEDGAIDLEKPPTKEKLERMTRAYFPWPTVWTKITIKNKEVLMKLLPGNKIQLEGKNPMTVKDFINGYPETKELLQAILL